MFKIKCFIFIAILILVISACSGAPTPAAISQAESPATEQADSPTPFPDTPAPVAINAPLVEVPSLVKIQFLNELDGWGVTETQIVRTNDGGITWYNITPPDMIEAGYGVDISILDNNHVWVQKPDLENYPSSGMLYRTSDGGITWTSTSSPFSRADITFLDPNNGWALADLGAGAGSNAIAVFQTSDGGATWTQTYTNDPNQANSGESLPLGGIKSGLTPLDMQTAWVYGVVYSSGTIYLFRTDDRGVTWNQVSTLPLPPDAENFELSINQLDFVSASDAFLTMLVPSDQLNLAVYSSSDSGNTWSLTPTLIRNGGSADFLSATEAVIYNGEQFYVTRDAASTWNIILPDVGFGDAFAMMDFVNISTGWIITVDLDNHRALYRTSDGGLTWSTVIP